ncbi:MAG: Y-family DNA polymerase [Pseudomonadota bacterium]
MSLWLYCHFPDLLLDTMRRMNPVIDNYPLALYQQQTQRETVLQCNKKARQLGVEKTQTQVLAQSIAPDLICRPYSEEKESRALKHLADKLYQSVDKLVLFPPQGIAIALDSLLRLYQGVGPLLEHLKETFYALELNVSLSLGHSPESAKCLAVACAEQFSDDRRCIQQALGELSISQLGWGVGTTEKLSKSGIKQLKQLMLIPTAQVGKRFGREVVNQLKDLKGEHVAPYTFYQPAEYFYMSLDLVTEIEHWQGLLFPLKRLLKELEQFLYQRQKVIRELDITLHHRQQQKTKELLRFAADNWRASQFLQLIQLQVTRSPLKQPVIALSIHADKLSRLDRESGQLLAEASRHQSDLQELLSRLQARLGQTALYSPGLSTDPRPRHNEMKKAAGDLTLCPAKNLKRPLWLLANAEPVDIQQWHLVEGPERIETGWWDESPYERDYWLATDQYQRNGWLYFQKGHWFLQGWFS